MFNSRMVKFSVMAAVFGLISCTSDFEKIPEFNVLKDQSEYCLWNDNFNTCSPIAELGKKDDSLCVKYGGKLAIAKDCIFSCIKEETCTKFGVNNGMGKDECNIVGGEIVNADCAEEPSIEPPPPPPPQETWPKFCIYSNSCTPVSSADKIANECTDGEEALLFNTRAECLEFTLIESVIYLSH